MKKISVLFALLALSLPQARAETLSEALTNAYQTNPQLQAAQAELRAVDNQVAVALSGWRPSVTGSAGINWQETDRLLPTAGKGVSTPRDGSISVQQPLFRGFRTVGASRSAKARVMGTRARLVAVEQQLLLDAATAYVNVYRDQAVLGLTKSNGVVLRRQLEATQDRFDAGEVTRTDVSQAESRLARAVSDRIQAEGNLESSRANYVRIVGRAPEGITKPGVEIPLPASEDEAVETSQFNHPSVAQAEYALDQADHDVTTTTGALLPEISGVAAATRSYDQSFVGPHRVDTTSVGVRATIPLYTGGADYARIRASKQTVAQRQQELDDQVRRAKESAVQAWQQLVTARAAIDARQKQVSASEMALEGVKQESSVGTRTTIDVLDAEQELLDAKVSLVRAERDEIVAIMRTKASVGQLTAKELGLPVNYYDPALYYDDNAESWFGVN